MPFSPISLPIEYLQDAAVHLRMQPMFVAEAPCATVNGQIRWGREAHRALFGKKMPAAANIDSVAANGADGLRSQWREEINRKHHKRGLFSTNSQLPSSGGSH